MALINADTGNFKAKLATLKAGDTLQLAAGNYGSLYIANTNYGSGITIKGGTFSSIGFSKVTGVTLDGTTVIMTPTLTSTSNDQAIRAWASNNITITNAKITGGLAVNGVAQSATTLDASGNVLGLPVGKGINFESSNNVAVTNSDISFFHKGITFGLGSNVTVSGNTIHDLRTTPISGSVVSGLTITGNRTWDSHPWQFGGSGDHGDRIHVWTDKTPITGLVIADNRIEQGNGDPMLGIYLDDNGKNLGFPGAVITNNTLVDAHSGGLVLENVTGIVSGNNLIWSGTGSQVGNSPRIHIGGGSRDIVFTDNSGDVVVKVGSRNLQFWHQDGSFSYDSTLTAADRLTITQDATVVTREVSFAIDALTDNLTYGGSGDFTGTGNALANTITGGSGNDRLIGNGGADTLIGGLGNDSYVVDNGSQKIVDSGGTDSVFASLSWTLQSGVENLYFTGTGDAVLTGNSGNNQIFGGSGNDTLNGGGGTDVLNGGQGDDLYYISNSGQSIVDAGGIDSVVATGSYVLVAAMENLRVSGTNNANLTGNDLANTLRGNSGANIIKGMAGVDTMYGAGGNDTYYVDDIGDQAIEVEAGVDLGGIDFVRAMVSSVTLGAGIENLGYFGKENFTGIGNALANTIGGYGGNDWLYGLDGNDILSGSLGNDVLDGGAGADRLTGGSGYDIFLLGKGEAGGDSITDFKGNGTGLGDIIKLTGWGAGTTMVQGIGSNWVITDGIDRSVAMVSITGALHPSDVLFG